MNKTVSLLIVSLLGLAVLFSVTNKSDDIVIVIGDEPLAELPVEEIHSIHIESIDDMDQAIKTLHLKRGEKQWLVANEQDYPADSDRILRFINNFIDMKVLREVSASKTQLGRLHLAEPSKGTTNAATRVILGGKDKPMHVLMLGKEITGPKDDTANRSPFGGGNFPDRRFVMIDGKHTSITVVDQTFSSANPDPSDWLNKEFFKVENPTRIAVTYHGDQSTNSWSIVKQDVNGTAQWGFEGGLVQKDQLDESKIPSTPFTAPSFDALATDQQAKLIDENATQVKIDTQLGVQYSIAISPKIDGAYFLKLSVNNTRPEKRSPGEDESDEEKKLLDDQWAADTKAAESKLTTEKKFTQRIYKVPTFTVDSVLKNRLDLIASEDNGAIQPPGGGADGIPQFNLPNFPPNPGN